MTKPLNISAAGSLLKNNFSNCDKTAREYFKGGEYVKARKIWEKVVEDASKGMVK